jgi:chromosomal replication initiator protein
MKPTVRRIKEAVREQFPVSMQALNGARRYSPKSRVHIPRQTAMYLSRRYARKSWQDIANKFGRTNHTTAIHAFRVIEQKRLKSKIFDRKLNAIERAICPVDSGDEYAFPANGGGA